MRTQHVTLLFVLLFAALAPYIYAACYIVPLADDYCMAWESIRHPDLLSAVSHMYHKWNGRYTADVLVMVNPFIRWGNAGYELASILMILSGVIVNYLVARRFLAGEALRWIAALTVQLLFLFQLPDLSEGIFWYNGYMLYYLPGLVSVIALLLISDILDSGSWRAVLYIRSLIVIALIIMIAGFNEPMAVMSLLFFTGLFAFTFYRYPRMRIFLGGCILSALAGVLIVWFAPGNRIRAAQFHFDRSIITIALMTHLQIIRFMADWISGLPFIALSIVVLVRAGSIRASWIDQIRLWWVAVALYLTMVLCIALPYWFTGVLGQQRTVNMAYYFFLSLALTALVRISRAKFVFRALSFMSGSRVLTGILATAIIFMAVTKNGYKLGYDIAYGNLPKYKAEQVQRGALLSAHLHDDSFKLAPMQTRPLSLTLYDGSNPKFYWAELCQRQYLLKKEEQASR